MDFHAREKVHDLSGDVFGWVHDNRGMADESPNHLRAWRKHRGMTQQKLADTVKPPTTKQVIAALESGQNGLSLKWLYRLADALETRAGYLLHDPEDVDGKWLAATDNVPQGRREEAIRILKVLSSDE